jgi:gliding motility-associated-like protein
MQSFKIINYLVIVVLLSVLPKNLNAQTDLQGGDIAILGVNANSAACGGSGGTDVVTFVAFKDITNGTEFDITDNGWERVSAGLWGDSEGTYRMTRTGGTIPAGTSFELTLITSFTATQTANPDWTFINLNVPSTFDRNVNMNSGGDQMYVMQGGVWDNGGETGEHDATYNGKVLYGFNTRTIWNADGSSQQSNLHPDVDPCFFMNPTGGTTNYVNYTGPTTATTQLEWINRIKDPTNWTSYTNCTDYNNNPPPSILPISTNDMSISCAICAWGCGSYNETLTFNLPSTGGPFDVVYTDGSSNFTLSDITNGYTEIVSLSASTTFSLVSVTALNGCPIYSNFAGEAQITFTGSGGGPNASLSGGGVLCSDNCSIVTITIAGPTAPPYTLDGVLDLPPFVNNFPVTIQVTSINFELNVCSQGLIPTYDINTATLSVPNFILGNLTFTLTGITDNAGCPGTVDPTPFFMDIEETPTAFAAGPIIECDEGGNASTFNLLGLNTVVNGGSSNSVNWYEDMLLSTTINNPSNYSTTSTTVYATSNSTNCESDPVAVQLIVNSVPTAFPASLSACSSTGTVTFDLSTVTTIVNGGTGLPVEWFMDVGGNIPIINWANYTSGSGVVYATVTENGCPSIGVPITLTVVQTPIGFPSTMTVCESTIIPTFGEFDLSTINNDVNGGTGLPVAWFTDASATMPIPGSLLTTQDNTIVYAVIGSAPCTSLATQVTLFVTPFPPVVSTTMQECAVFGNQAVFDLTAVENTVNAGSGATVSWFEDVNGLNQILLPNSYLSSSTFVYVQTINGICTSPILPVELIVTPGIIANSTSASECDEGNGTASFDLNNIGLNVNNELGNTVNWYFDSNATIPISSPYSTASTIVYAQVTNANCVSQIVAIGLSIDIVPTANITTASNCDLGNGTANFDLNVLALDINSTQGNTVNWYSDRTGSFPIFSPYNTGSTTIYAEVSDGNCTSPIIPISLNVEDAPIANNAIAVICDLGNGTGDFDLTLIENDINNIIGNTINWYSDAGATLLISSPYNTASTTVYAIVSNGNCPSNIAEIILSVENAPAANSAIGDDCDIGDGTANFDLTTLALVVNTNPAYSVNWFLNANGTNPILTSPFNTSTTQIYAVVSNVAGCESVPVQVDLNVINTPAAFATSGEECETTNGTAEFDLMSLENIVNGGSSYAVSWYSDSGGTNLISSPYNSGSAIIYAVVNGALCNSQPVAVDLIVNSTPAGVSTTASECINDGSGLADFDLTSLESTVNGGTNHPVLWYSDMGITNQIFSPYNAGTTVIYAIITIGNCISEPVPVDLIVENQPTANTTFATLCDIGNGTAIFDLTTLESTINGGTSDPVDFFSDSGGTLLISSPFNTSTTIIYASVTVGFCSSEPVAINLTVENVPTGNASSATLCDEGIGMATFDLTSLENTIGSGNLVNWYSDINGTNNIASPYFSGTTTIYAVVGNMNCTSEPIAIDLVVEDLPVANLTSTSLCDDGNGTATFDLTTLENIVNGGNGNIVLWYSDANATMTINSPYLSSATTIYAIVDNGNCLSSSVSIDLNITTTPEISGASAALCDEGGGMAIFDLSTIENIVNGGNGNTVSWFLNANGTNSISSPFNSSSTTIYAIVSDANCTSSAEGIDLTVANLPEANSATLSNCDSGNGTAEFDLNAILNIVNGGNGNPINWYSDVNLTNSISSPFNSSATTIYAVVNDVSCTAEAVEVTLEISNDIEANPTSLSSCNDGTGTAIYDLTNLNFQDNITGGNGNSILWFEDAAANIPLSPPFDEFETTPTLIYAIVVNGSCSSIPVEISLTLSPEVPVVNNYSLSSCDDGNGTASFDLDMQEDVINLNNGNQVFWFADQNLTLAIASPFVSASTIIYAIATDGVCFSEIVEVELIIFDNLTVFPTTDTQCDDGNGTATFNLADLENIVNGGNGNTVNWYTDSVATILSPTMVTSGNTSVYAIVTDGNCLSEVVEITLIVENSLSAFSTIYTQCDDGNGTATFDLTTLENTVNGGTGNTVIWYTDSGATIPSSTSITSGNTSVYAIVTDGSCLSQIVEINLTIENIIVAFSTTDTQCDGGNGTAIFDLTTLENSVNGGSGNMVSWYTNAGATIPSPFIITSGNASVYAIVTDGICSSQIVEITLIVENSLTAFSTTDIQCDDGSGIAIFDLIALENIVSGGSGNTVIWFSDQGATIPSPTTILTGDTSVYAIVTNGICYSPIVEIILAVDNNLSAFSTTDTQCDDGNGTATFDLTALENIINGGNGNMVSWYMDDGATIPSLTTITSGNASVYAIVTDGVCSSQIVEVVLAIEDNPIAFSTINSQCDEGGGIATFNLTLLENIINGGNGNMVSWYTDAGATIPSSTTVTSASTSVYGIVSSGTCFSQIVEIELSVTLNSTNDLIQTLCDGESIIVNSIVYDELNASGTEIIPGGNMNGCDSIINVDLTFEPEITGTISASTNIICPNTEAILTFNLTGGSTYNVEFSEGNNPPILLNGISDGHTITVLPSVTTIYSLEAVIPLNNSCIGVIPTTQITIQVEEVEAIVQPTSQFGNFNISCFNENDGAAIAVPISGAAPFQFLWSNGSTSPNIQNVFAGNYDVTITDALGCSTTASTTLIQPSEIQLVIISNAPPCSAIFDGQIILDNIFGGSGNYSYSLDGSGFTVLQDFPTVLDFVSPGGHSLTISDDNGCLISDQVIVPEPLEIEVDLGSDEIIELGDSIEIQSILSFTPTEIIWSANSNCDNCLSQFVSPIDQSTYTVTMFDENGCLAVDSITIFVEKNQNVFIPNGFSPDDNGFNDIFYINAGQDVARVKNFRIFNRWGDVIFENENFQPNDPTEGWDGFFNGEKLNPNVFIFFAEIEFKDGLVKIFKGDITLTK